MYTIFMSIEEICRPRKMYVCNKCFTSKDQDEYQLHFQNGRESRSRVCKACKSVNPEKYTKR